MSPRYLTMEARPLTTTSSASSTEILTWFFLVVSFFAVGARLGTKLATTKRAGWDDLACVLSLIFNIAAGASVTVLAENGLGERTVDAQALEVFQKSMYAVQIFYLSTICAAKLSIIFLLRSLSRDTQHRRLGLPVGAIIAGWGIISLILALFQCKPPNVWQTVSGQCYNREVFWRFVGAMNIITDVLLIALPLFIVYSLQMPIDKKIIVSSSFGTRIFDIAATACQLAFTNAFHSGNATLNIWPWIICAQLSQTISIITSCIPYLRPLLDAFGNGIMYNEEVTRHVYGTAGSVTANGYAKRLDHDYIVRDFTQNSRTGMTLHSVHDIEEEDTSDAKFGNTATASAAAKPPVDNETLSNHSSSHSQSRIIKATTTVETVFHAR